MTTINIRCTRHTKLQYFTSSTGQLHFLYEIRLFFMYATLFSPREKLQVT